MKEAQIKSWIEAPRWAGLPAYLRELAYKLDCKIDVKAKGLVFQLVVFEVRGDYGKLVEFKRSFEEEVRLYNEPHS